MNHHSSELIKLAKRDNNTKRPYLLVNPLQGKHIPVSPAVSMELFQKLCHKAHERYGNERILFIGFAETATAIGSALAVMYPFDSFYIQTTREHYPEAEYLYFTESHSHATEQKLIINNLKEIIGMTDRILFVEDEVTTGNTIESIMKLLNNTYSEMSMRFGIVSIINGMSDIRLKELALNGIDCIYLCKAHVSDYEARLKEYSYPSSLRKFLQAAGQYPVSSIKIGQMKNPRFGLRSSTYLNMCRKFTKKILADCKQNYNNSGNLLVLGTEEFMFPGLLAAEAFEREGIFDSVRFHATTRSPILPSGEADYPLHSRYQLSSLYDRERVTFLYNLKSYDTVIILHDSHAGGHEGLLSLYTALQYNRCNDIRVYEWSE